MQQMDTSTGEYELQKGPIISSTRDNRLLGEQLINYIGDERQTVGEEKVIKPTAWGRQQCFTHQDLPFLDCC